MHRTLRIAAIVVIALSTVSTLIAQDDEKKESKDGIDVTITKAADTIKGFRAFSVTAVNTLPADKSVEIRIFLNDSNSKEPRGLRGECTVFIGLHAKDTQTQAKECKEKSASNSWSFEIVKVYNFYK